MLAATSLVGDIMTGFCCWAAVDKKTKHNMYSAGSKEQSFELNANQDNIQDLICIFLTKSACVLKLYLEHFHWGGDNDLARTCTTTCQHLFEHGQTLSVNRQEKH